MLINEVDDDVRGGASHYSMPSVNSRLQVLKGTHIWGVYLMHFYVYLYFVCFLGVLGCWRGIPQEIAGNNTDVCHCIVKFY